MTTATTAVSAQREPTLHLVSRFRSSHHCAAHSFANFGIKGTLAIYDSSAVFGFEVPTRTRGYNDRNFKSTALVSPTGTLGNSPPRTLGEHGSSLWNRVMTEYHIEDVGGRELLALVCQQLDPCGSAKGPDRFRG